MPKNVLFIHRSVGHNLLEQGQVYGLIKPYGHEVTFSDYDHNSGILSTSTSQKKLGYVFPGGNTNPADYAKLFNKPTQETKKILDWISSYDVVILKSCYPNSNIQSDEELEEIKTYYQGIVKYFGEINNQLGILTSPPLRPLVTKADRAKRARGLANWLMSEDFGNNVKVFDLFDLLAVPNDKRGANRLSWKYKHKLVFFDSHPNRKANKTIAPKFVKFIRSI